MALDVSVTEALKVHYTDDAMRDMVYKDQPLLALLPKDTKFGGLNLPVPIIHGNPQRRSHNFTVAQDNTSTSALKQFILTRKKDYSLATITGEAIEASRSDADAFMRYATMEIDGAIHSLKRSLGVSLYRDGTGAIGKASVTAANPTSVTLQTPAEIVNFEVGMVIVAADGSGAPRNAAGASIETINREAGSFTCGNTLGSVVAGDNFYVKGDYTSGATKLKLTGLDAYVPATSAAAATTLHGCVRAADVTRLGGQRSDGTTKPIEEALIDGMVLVAREGGRPSHIFCDFVTYANLEKALGSKVQYVTADSPIADIGFDGIRIHGPTGTVKVIPDVNCQPNVAWILQMDTWKLHSLGECPRILQLDDQRMLRQSNADAYEVRVGYYAELACSAPGFNCRVAL